MELYITIGKLINLLMCAVGLGVTIVSLLELNKSVLEKKARNFFGVFLILLCVYIVMNLLRVVGEGQPGKFVSVFLRIVAFFDFLTSGIMVAMLALMILYMASPEKYFKTYMIVIQVSLVLHVAGLIIAQFTNHYYFFDDVNVYHRGNLYIVSNIVPILLLLQCAQLLIRFRKNISKKILIALWIYLLAPLVATIAQGFYQDIKFIIIATTIAAVNMSAVIVDELTKKYENQRIENSRIETELSMATRIQADMLPNIFPAFPERKEFDIYATMNPAKEVGGDFYDFFIIDNDHLGLVMADVSGKGVPAALFMMASKILIQNYAIMHNDPKLALEATNHQICQNNHEEMFVTVWLGILNLSTGLLVASNAGHEFPAIKMPNEKFELYHDTHGFVVGGMSGVKYQSYEIQLKPDSMLFLYTDGVAEATNSDEELFGTDRMIDALNKDGLLTPNDVLESVDSAVKDFVKEAPQFDDLTMLCVKYNGKIE